MTARSLGLALASLCAGLGVSSLVAAPSFGDAPAPALFAGLERGQVVAIADKPGGIELTSVPGVSEGYRVLDVQRDFVVIEAPEGLYERRIPVTAIRSVTFMRPFPKR